MAIRVENVSPEPFKGRDDVTIVWKGGRISKLLFPSGKVISFDHDEIPSEFHKAKTPNLRSRSFKTAHAIGRLGM